MCGPRSLLAAFHSLFDDLQLELDSGRGEEVGSDDGIQSQIRQCSSCHATREGHISGHLVIELPAV